MNSVTLRHPGMHHYEAFHPRNVYENSLGVKLASMFPIISWGNTVYEVAARSLNERMSQTTYYTPALVELIEIKNELTIFNTVGNLILTAIMVSIVASSIISGAAIASFLVPSAFGLFAGVMSIENIRNIIHNKGIIEEIRTTGFREGMQIR